MIRRPLRLVLRPLLLLLALAWVPFVVFSAVDVDLWWVVPSLVAFLPYAIVGTALVALVCLLLKARVIALVAVIGLAVLLVPRAGRVTADPQPAARGPQLVVATSNVAFGGADVAALVRLVREERVDVLAVQEDTPDVTTDLTAAGLRELLPYTVLRPRPGAAGVSLYSAFPVRAVEPTRFDFRSRGGLVTLPGGQVIHVRSVHPPPPFRQELLRPWQRRTTSLPGPREDGTSVILAGDFNATSDHHPFASLLERGYRDAADETGNAWRPTWSNGRWATLTLDHVLVPPGVAVEEVAVHDLARTDHDVVVSTLRLRG